MGTPATAAGMQAFCDSIINPPQTDARRLRDGLQIAMDGLGQSSGDRHVQRILLALHWLYGPERQDVLAWWAHQLVKAAEGYAEYVGDADAGEYDPFDDMRDRAEPEGR